MYEAFLRKITTERAMKSRTPFDWLFAEIPNNLSIHESAVKSTYMLSKQPRTLIDRPGEALDIHRDNDRFVKINLWKSNRIIKTKYPALDKICDAR